MVSNPPKAPSSTSASASASADSVSFSLSSGWNVEFHPLASDHQHDSDAHNTCTKEGILVASVPLATLYAQDDDAYRAFAPQSTKAEAVNAAEVVALADYAARTLHDLLPAADNGCSSSGSCSIQTMGQSKNRHIASANAGKNQNRRQRRKNNMMNGKKKEVPIPYVLERTDCMVVQSKNKSEGDGDGAKLQFFLHTSFSTSTTSSSDEEGNRQQTQTTLNGILSPVLDQLTGRLTSRGCYAHVACVVLQQRLRAMLQPPRNKSISMAASMSDGEEEKSDKTDDKYLNAVAFIADGSLLPRKSGRSTLPMSSPPAVPFASPEGSEQLTRVVTVEVGSFWRRYLNEDGRCIDEDEEGSDDVVAMDTTTTSSPTSTTVTMRGMIIPTGVTLIVGGGYHGKSTILQALCMGVYDTLPGDGRERCVTHIDAVSIRAEDGRYVHNTNVSAFISNLPSGKSINGASIASKKQDTSRFSSKDASGSTSQAANVIEALECGASTLLVDEDVSAANFMARDGRMRAMIMDEPITPLLYRVNGLFLSKEHQVSTVVVVGGVGEWLDVADAVVLMKDYVAHDGLKKARSVSYQFSYGHVQYAGKGVVHRLPWEVKEEKPIMNGDDENDNDEDDEKKPKNTTLNPLRRKPGNNCVVKKFRDAAVHLLESGSSRLWFYPDGEPNGNDGDNDDDNDEDDGMVDMSKSSQLVGNASEQLYGCGICVLWLIQESLRRPEEDFSELLNRMEEMLDNGIGNGGGGMNELISSLKRSQEDTAVMCNNNIMISELLSSHDVLDLWETVGFAYRPRRHEVAMALTRIRGMRFDILPDRPRASDMPSSEEEAKRLEEESKKRALAEMWANRRKR